MNLSRLPLLSGRMEVGKVIFSRPYNWQYYQKGSALLDNHILSG